MDETRLSELSNGERAIIKDLAAGHRFQGRMAALGIRVGKTLRKIASQPLRGPIVIEIDRSLIALGQGMAEKIFVEKIESEPELELK